jgi:acyl-CoA dehydrogenase
MFKAQNAFEGVIANYPNRFIAAILYWYIFPLGRPYVVPADSLGHEVAASIIEPGATRDRLSAGMYVPRNKEEAENDAVGVIELALELAVAAEGIEAKIRAAQKAKKVGAGGTAVGTVAGTAKGAAVGNVAQHALEAGIITAAEFETLKERDRLRDKVIRVDDFAQDFSHEQQHSHTVRGTPPPLRQAA